MAAEFDTYNNNKVCSIHSNDTRLRILLKKVSAFSLKLVKFPVNVEINQVKIWYTFAEALASFHNTANQQCPPQISSGTRNHSQINGTHHTCAPGQRRDRGCASCGVGGPERGRDNYSNAKWRITDIKMITLTYSQHVEYHPSLLFPWVYFWKVPTTW